MNPIGTQEMRTERLLLRRFTEEDALPAWRNYGSDPLVNRYITFSPCRTREGAEAFMRLQCGRYESDRSFFAWALAERAVGEIIGSVVLFRVDAQADSCELGMCLGSRWWGRGYMTEAVTALLDFAFHRAGMHRVYGTHHVENAASGRVMRKCGMKYEGTLRGAQKNADGTYSDLKVYAALAGEMPAAFTAGASAG